MLMKVIGLCGGSGSGKGSACRIFWKHGIPFIDTDAIYHEIISAPGECLTALANEFGNEIITDSGSLNRRRLAEIVFSGENSAVRLERLNEIAHKYILDEARRRLDEYRRMDAVAAIVDAPALFESGFDSECDILICVIADREIRIDRIIRRDGITREDAEKRIASQVSDAELVSRCDYMIRNDSDVDSLEKEVKSVLKKILTKIINER